MAETGSLRYPGLWWRAQAAMIDIMLLWAAFFAASIPVARTDLGPAAKIAIVAAPILVLEPVLVWLTGATLGHHLKRLRVQDSKSGKNIGPIRAVLRFLTKATIGTFSLIFMLLTRRHQAIHDLMFRSVVVFKSSAELPEEDAYSEREVEETGFVYPSRVRRILVILAYIFVVMTVTGTIAVFAVSQGCIERSLCTSAEDGIQYALGLTQLVTFVLLVVQGWRCRLWGCRRHPAPISDRIEPSLGPEPPSRR